MEGKRLPDGEAPSNPGEYSLMAHGRWWVVTPNGRHGYLDIHQHSIIEHPDGTITVRPSILIPRANDLPEFHGWLTAGEWLPV